jgi:tRNA(fMet)-specific endonuclease VapC
VSFLLDTDTCSFHLRHPSGLIHRFIQYSGRIFISTIGLAELYAWAYGRPDPAPTLLAINTLRQSEAMLLHFDASCAEQFGKLRGILRSQGISVPTVDLMIASVALVHDLTLVTHNVNDYRNVPNLRIEDWLTP